MTTDAEYITGPSFSEKVQQGRALDRARRREENARAVLAETSTRTEDTDTDNIDDTHLDQFLAVSESTLDGTRMWTTADSSRGALENLEYDEHPEDWRPVHLFDLDDDGAPVPFTARLAWGYTFQTTPGPAGGAYAAHVTAAPSCTSDDPTNHQGDTCPIHEGA